MIVRHPSGLLGGAALAGALALAGAGGVWAQESQTVPRGFEDMVAEKLPSVVGILSSVPAGEMPRRGAPQLPPGMEDFFGRPMPDMAPQPRRAQGSGFAVSVEGQEPGLIVTNAHVVAGAQSVTVQLDDGSEHEAEIVGVDRPTDLALLRIDGADAPPPADWGASSELPIGAWVVAIGNPFGLDGTVTAGILSARARDINAGPYDSFLQTDAAINSGNSGGPLFDAGGNVIGVNTAIFSPSGGNVGIGFAVPSDVAQGVVADLADDGQVERGWLGVTIQPVDGDLAEALGLGADAGGALVADLAEGGPADAAGLRPGDVIVGVAGTGVEAPRDLVFAVADLEMGATVEVTFLRGGARESVEVTVGSQPEGLFGAAAPAEGGAEPDTPRLGVTVGPLDAGVREQAGIPPEVSGVFVAGVAPGTPAAEAGLQAGDVIAEIGGETVDDAETLRAAIADAEDAPLLLRVWRAGGYTFVPVTLAPGDSSEG